MQRALITGITGQDGSFLAELLRSKGFEVHGIVRRSSSLNTGRIDHLCEHPSGGEGFVLHRGDVTDAGRMRDIVYQVSPDYVFHLAAQSHVAVSFDEPSYTTQTIVNGTMNMLEAMRSAGGKGKFYEASSSEMFGASGAPQDEDTPFRPQSPYGCAKVYAHQICQHYREAYGMFICCGILFNHESPRRGETFVTRKITRAATRISCGLQDTLILGDVSPKRDWGFAGDYVAAMLRMLQQDKPDDYVIATGRSETIRFALEYVFNKLGLDIDNHVCLNAPRYRRPTDVFHLCGDSSKARERLGWEPTLTLEQTLDSMIEHDHRLATLELIQTKVGA